MTDHITLLVRFSGQLKDLDMVQDWIDQARVVASNHPDLQPILDRKYEDVERKRMIIQLIMMDIANRN